MIVVAPAYAPQLMVTQAKPTKRIGAIELFLFFVTTSTTHARMNMMSTERTTQSMVLLLNHIATGKSPNMVDTDVKTIRD